MKILGLAEDNRKMPRSLFMIDHLISVDNDSHTLETCILFRALRFRITLK